ncbi:MAG: inosine monophosphate cyclohydrolase [Chloroflexi bacterium]|nr:inosine monophosphate cyclohydrolase [Chloroflexota bacterium]
MTSSISLSDGMKRLAANPYPGRGIIVGANSIGTAAVQVYWIMGRSENSRSRVIRREGNAVKVEPLGGRSLAGAELLIYSAMLQVGRRHVVSNGDQTDTIANALASGRTFESAMLSRRHEPDAPHYTPRVAGMVEIELAGEDQAGRPLFTLGKITSNPADGAQSLHSFHSFTKLTPGTGMCIHTYAGDGNPLPSFREDPFLMPLSASVDDIAQKVWESLNAANRVALVAKAIDIATGAVQWKVINRHATA